MISFNKTKITEHTLDFLKTNLKHTDLSQHNNLELFEQNLRNFFECQFVIIFNDVNDAFYAAYNAINLDHFDKVILTPVTSRAAFNPLFHIKARPVFIDVEKTNIISHKLLEHNLEISNTRGKNVVIIDHYNGQVVDVESIDKNLNDPSTIIIENGTEALGACYLNGHKVGSCCFSHMTLMSFESSGPINCGGTVITTNIQELYDSLKSYRDQIFGIKEKEYISLSTTQYLSEIQAILGNHQLQELSKWQEKRKKLAKDYQKSFQKYSLPENEFLNENLIRYPYFLNTHKFKPKEIINKLLEKKIECKTNPLPLYYYPDISKMVGEIKEYFPIVEENFAKTLNLPFHEELNSSDINYIAKNLKDILAQ